LHLFTAQHFLRSIFSIMHETRDALDGRTV
jgi:hypothetical protein